MIGNMTVYAALTEPGDAIMSLTQPFGGHSSNRPDGPAGVRGLRVHDVPMDPAELEVDLGAFKRTAREIRPKLVALGASMTLFPFPVRAIAEVVSEWGGRVFFDGAHQLGLIGGGQFQDPLREGACVLNLLRPAERRHPLGRPGADQAADGRDLPDACRHPPGQPRGGARGRDGVLQRRIRVRPRLHGPDRGQRPSARPPTARAGSSHARRAQGLHAHPPGDRGRARLRRRRGGSPRRTSSPTRT